MPHTAFVGSPRQNKLLSALSALSAIEWQQLYRALRPVFMPLGHVVYEPNAQREHVYFPTTSIISFSYMLADGGSAEFAVVGNDGFVGVAVFMGGGMMPSRAIVQSEGWAYRLTSGLLQAELMQGVAMRHLLLQYAQALITQIAQTAVCNRHHSIEQRTCRRLLFGLDRGTTDEVTLTHDVLANLMGVSRDGVTKAMRELQRLGIIHYRRGHITVINRADLEARCCECYGVVKRETDRLQGRSADVAGLPGSPRERNEYHYPTSVPTMRNEPCFPDFLPVQQPLQLGGMVAGDSHDVTITPNISVRAIV
jgi:CRP-like cAMP-binding protein